MSTINTHSDDNSQIPSQQPSPAADTRAVVGMTLDQLHSRYLYKAEGLPPWSAQLAFSVDDWANAWGECVLERKKFGDDAVDSKFFDAESEAGRKLETNLETAGCTDIKFLDGFVNFSRGNDNGYIQLST